MPLKSPRKDFSKELGPRCVEAFVWGLKMLSVAAFVFLLIICYPIVVECVEFWFNGFYLRLKCFLLFNMLINELEPPFIFS